MSIFSALFDQGKIYNFQQAFGVKDITTAEMQTAIRDWAQLYYQAEATPEEDPCQRIPVLVVSTITRAVFSEYQADSDNEDAKRILLELGRVKGKAVQQALIGGQSFLKPVFGATGLAFSVIPRGSYLPLGRNEQDEITDIGTAERTVEGRNSYTLLERRRVDAIGNLVIESKLYLSGDGQTLGVQVPLDTLEKYAGLVPELVLPGVGSIGLIPVRCPQENTVDGSPDAVSIFASAAGLIHNLNRNEAQLDRELENGRSRVFASADLLKTGADGRKRLSDDLFVGLDDDPETVGVTVYSPELRVQSFLDKKMDSLRSAESLMGLKRGLLSNVETVQKTATQITDSAGSYNLTIIGFQRMWEDAVREAIRVCEILGRLYKVFSGSTIDQEKDITISWGNGVLYDEDKTWEEYKSMAAAGMLKTEIALGWYFDLPRETEADLAYIRKRYMPEQDAPVDE